MEGSDREAMETSFRRLLEEDGLAQPDEIQPHPDGGIICLWHDEKLAVIVDPDPPEGTERAFPV